MFQSARIKLTAWYLLIIMLVSSLFSVVIYTGINREYSRIEQIQKIRQERALQLNPSFEEFRKERQKKGVDTPPMSTVFEPEAISEARIRLQIILLMVNAGILAVAGFAGYFLAGRTLKPIKEMVDEQNRFITDSSHELRTPLTTLRSEIEVNLRDKALNLIDAKKLLQSNLEEVINLQALSDGLIKLTQYQKRESQMIVESINLSLVVNEAVKKISSLASYKKIKIQNKVGNIKILGEGQLLTEVFVILLDNAIKYSLPRGEVIILSKQTINHVEISVSDKGSGIDPKDLPHIFERFFRADESRTKSDISGYGLGLSIAKQIIEKHRGLMKVVSELGKGTTIVIELPINNNQ